MLPRTRWLTLAAAVAVAALFSGAPDSPLQAQPKGAAKKATKKKPPRRVAAQHIFKVQARNPHWQVSGVTSKPVAQAVARRLKSQGWSARIKAKQGLAVVRYR